MLVPFKATPKLAKQAGDIGLNTLEFFKKVASSPDVETIFPIERHGWSIASEALGMFPSVFENKKMLDYGFPQIPFVERKNVLLFSTQVSRGDTLKSVVERVRIFEPTKIITAAYAVLKSSTYRPDIFVETLSDRDFKNYMDRLLIFFWLKGFWQSPESLTLQLKIHPKASNNFFKRLLRELGEVYAVQTPILGNESVSLIPKGFDLEDPTNLVRNIEFSKVRIFFLKNGEIAVSPIIAPEISAVSSNEYLKFVKERCFFQRIATWPGNEHEKMLLFIDWLVLKLTLQLVDWFLDSLRKSLLRSGKVYELSRISWPMIEVRYPDCREFLKHSIERSWP